MPFSTTLMVHAAIPIQTVSMAGWLNGEVPFLETRDSEVEHVTLAMCLVRLLMHFRQGIKEIKAAEALERRRQRKARKGSGGFLSSLFGRRKSKPATSTRGTSGRGRQPPSRQATGTRRPAPPHRRSTNASKQSKHSQRSGAGSGHRPSQQQRPSNVRRTTTRRSGR